MCLCMGKIELVYVYVCESEGHMCIFEGVMGDI